jgi:drug/metabolite transporter (DMT)-like permease
MNMQINEMQLEVIVVTISLVIGSAILLCIFGILNKRRRNQTLTVKSTIIFTACCFFVAIVLVVPMSYCHSGWGYHCHVSSGFLQTFLSSHVH